MGLHWICLLKLRTAQNMKLSHITYISAFLQSLTSVLQFKKIRAGTYCSMICRSSWQSVTASAYERSQQTDAKMHHSMSLLVLFPLISVSQEQLEDMSLDFLISSQSVPVDSKTNRPSLNSFMRDISNLLFLFPVSSFLKACPVFRHRPTLKNFSTPLARML